MIKLINICKKYKDKKVIENFNYEFKDTGLYFLIGKSGSGKTTLLNIISGIIKPTSGYILYENINSIYKETYYIYQDFTLVPNITVLKNIELVLSVKECKVDKDFINQKLEKIGLLDYKDKKASLLSGGERQRLSIVIALLLNTKVVIFDEPTASLDDENSNNVISLIRELSKEKLVIVSTHNKNILNDNDIIIDTQNLINNYFDSENIDIKPQKKISLNKKFFFIKNQFAKKQIVRFVMQIAIFAFLISGLSILFSLSNTTLRNLETREIINNNHNIYFDYKGDNEADKRLKCSDLKSYHLNKYYLSDNIKFYIDDIEKSVDYYRIIDNSLNDNEAIISSKLYEKIFGLNTDINDKNVKLGNAKLDIICVEELKNVSDYSNRNQNDYFIKINEKTFIDGYENKMSLGLTGCGYGRNETFYFTDDLKIDEIILSKKTLESEYSLDVNLEIGDSLSVNSSGHSFDVKIVGFNEEYNYLSKDIFRLYKLKTFDYLENPNYDSLVNYGNISNLVTYDETIELLKILEEHEYDIMFNNYKTIDELAYQIRSTVYDLQEILPIVFIVGLLFSIYNVYIMFKNNSRNFDTLRLLGVSKLGIFKISLLDCLESLILAIIISSYPFFKVSHNYIKDRLNDQIARTRITDSYVPDFELFDFKYFIIASLFVLIIIIICNLLFSIFRNKKTTFIN